MAKLEVKVPYLGDFKNIPVIDVLGAPGSTIKVDDTLVTLESDKATMEVPSPRAGTIVEVRIKKGDKVSEGTTLFIMETADEAGAPAPAAAIAAPVVAAATPAPAAANYGGPVDMEGEVVVLGAGPGGYTAAFRAADLGKKVILIERSAVLGGVCLNVGCIPSKALLHAAKVIDEAADMAANGIAFGTPKVDHVKLRGWKDGVVKKLTTGLTGLAKQRKVTVVTGVAKFVSDRAIEVETPEGRKVIGFQHAIIAAGSEPVKLPFIPHDDPRVIDSTGGLALDGIPDRLLIVGGGIIGLEMATIYSALGSDISIVELADQLIPGADKDLVTPLAKRIGKHYKSIELQTKVTKVVAAADGLVATIEGPKGSREETFDKILVSVGRRPNGKLIAAEKAGVAVDERGFIAVDKQQRTNVPHIFAIGDVVGQPMLAHKATHEGKVAAEVAAGLKSAFDAKVIPSVAYTDPEVAWVGVTENEAKAQGLKYGKGAFPWAASGRSLALGRDEGLTKVLFDEESHRIIGCGIVGPNAGDLIAEAALAIEMGADAADIGHTIHPHPTLSETVGMAAEAFEGTLTDLYLPKRKTG